MIRALALATVVVAAIASVSAGDATFDIERDGDFIVLRNGQTLQAWISPRHGGELSGMRVMAFGRWHELIYRARDYTEQPGFRGKAQLLWPATGRSVTADGRVGWYRLDGTEYPMPIHGFAGRSVWQVISTETTPNSAVVVLEMSNTAKSWRSYPFDFTLRVEYRLTRDDLHVTYWVIAGPKNRMPMPFSIGNHMSFNVPLVAGSRAGEMRVENNLNRLFLLDELSRFSGETRPSPFRGSHRLHDFPQRDPVPLGGADSVPTVTLIDPSGLAMHIAHEVLEGTDVESVDFNFWMDLEEQFFSPEPWIGTQNSLNSGLGLIRLEAGEHWVWRISLRCDCGPRSNPKHQVEHVGDQE